MGKRSGFMVLAVVFAFFAAAWTGCSGVISGGADDKERSATAVAVPIEAGVADLDDGGADAEPDSDAAVCPDATSDLFATTADLGFGFGDLAEVCIEPSLDNVCAASDQEPLGECSIAACACAATSSSTSQPVYASADAGASDAADDGGHTCEKKPIDGAFSCPAKDMTYNCGPKGCCRTCRGDQNENPNHFDCDDYALVCQHWALSNGYNVCQLSFRGTDLDPKKKTCAKCQKKYGGGADWGHVINIAEFTAGNCANAEGDVSGGCFCFVEPQSNSQKCCWPKTGSITDDPPKACWDKLCAAWDSKDCRKTKLWCTATHSSGAGEKPFYVHEAVCRALGSCGYEWKKLEGCKACQAENPDNECKAKQTNAQCTACCNAKHGSGTAGWHTCVRYAGCASKPNS